MKLSRCWDSTTCESLDAAKVQNIISFSLPHSGSDDTGFLAGHIPISTFWSTVCDHYPSNIRLQTDRQTHWHIGAGAIYSGAVHPGSERSYPTFDSRRGTGGGHRAGTTELTAKYTLSAPGNNRAASGAVLALSLWGKWEGQGCPKRGWSPENFGSHMDKYAVFDIKRTYNH